MPRNRVNHVVRSTLIQRDGKPVAIVINVENKDHEQIETENDPKFWKLIERSRRSPTIPWEMAEARLLGENAGRPAKTRKKKNPKKD